MTPQEKLAERIEKIISKDTQPCSNKGCKEGLVRVYIDTPDEGNMICKICNGTGNLEVTNKDKSQSLADFIWDKIPEEEECYCDKLNLKVGDTVCSNCVHNNARQQFINNLGGKDDTRRND